MRDTKMVAASFGQNNDAPEALSAAALDQEESYKKARDLLQGRLAKENGRVSSRAINAQLQKEFPLQFKGIMLRLQTEAKKDPTCQWRQYERSFYSTKEYDSLMKVIESSDSGSETDDQAVSTGEDTPEEEKSKRSPSNRKDEAKLCDRYLKPFFEELYGSSEDIPDDDVEIAFAVHAERPMGQLSNVDLIAIDWRSDGIAEIVTVEAKLEFSVLGAHQAVNYRRFSHRVWYAVVVRERDVDAGEHLQSEDRELFEYLISNGIGILACRPTQGKGYAPEVVQWPARQNPTEIEKRNFMENGYPTTFEKAGLLQPRRRFGRAA